MLPTLDRALPQSVEAEREILGSILTESSRLSEAIDNLSADDFYNPSHRLIYNAMLNLFRDGKELTDVLIGEELRRDANLERAGGFSYLAELQTGNPGVSIARYAKIVKGKALLRAIAKTADQVRDAALADDEDPDVVLDGAQAAMLGLTRTNDARSVMSDRQVAAMTRERLESMRPGENAKDPAIATPWQNLNNLCRGGIHDTELWGLSAIVKNGKALALDTAIPTPAGWTTMGELNVGDLVFDEKGKVCRVVNATEVMTDRPCYRMTFAGGQEVVCDAEHQWFTRTEIAARSERNAKLYVRERTRALKPKGTNQSSKRTFPSVVTTQQIAETLTLDRPNGNSYFNHRVPVCGSLQLSGAELPIHPYVLGVWLGDGSSYHASFTCDDPEIVETVRSFGQPARKQKATPLVYSLIGGLQVKLREAGLLQNKHIPAVYFRASTDQRKLLLQGLMDTDGSCVKNGTQCEFTSTNKALADGMFELACGLGLKPSMLHGRAKLYGKDCGPKYRVFFAATVDHQVFGLTRKAARLRDRLSNRAKYRSVVACVPCESVPVRCIQVDSPSSLFLITKNFIPTHNSVFVKQWAAFLQWMGIRALYFSREMSEVQIMYRMLAPLTGIPVSQIRFGIDDNRINQLIGATKELEKGTLFFDTKSSSVTDVRTRVREMIRLEGIQVVFIDYLQCFTSGKRSYGRADEIGPVWRGMKDIAQDFNTRVVAVAQFNREAFKNDERPKFQQTEGSGEAEKAVSVGMVLATDFKSGEPGARPAKFHIDYQRDEVAGGYVDLIFDGRMMEFRQPPAVVSRTRREEQELGI